jgi:hypothetical protein
MREWGWVIEGEDGLNNESGKIWEIAVRNCPTICIEHNF